MGGSSGSVCLTGGTAAGFCSALAGGTKSSSPVRNGDFCGGSLGACAFACGGFAGAGLMVARPLFPSKVISGSGALSSTARRLRASSIRRAFSIRVSSVFFRRSMKNTKISQSPAITSTTTINITGETAESIFSGADTIRSVENFTTDRACRSDSACGCWAGLFSSNL